MIGDRKTAVVVLDSGSPSRPDEVESFLLQIASDRRAHPLPWWREPFRPILAQAQARELGAAWRSDLEAVTIDSPLQRVSRAQAHGVAERLGCEGYAATLFGEPSIPETIDLMRSEGIERVLAIQVEPQSPDSGELVLREFERHWQAAGGSAAALQVLGDFAATREFIAIQALHLRETLDLLSDADTPLLFICRDPGQRLLRPGLEQRARGQVAALAEALFLGTRAQLGWLPSRSDEPGFPDHAASALDGLGAAGVRQVVLVPLGWVADRFETLYDVDMMLARRARASGMRIFRVPTLNDRPEFLEALARFVRGHPPRAGETEERTR